MQLESSAERIVSIQNLLGSASPSRGERAKLMREQRELWNRDHEGRPYEAISYDVWALRRFPA